MSDTTWRINAVLSEMRGQPKENILARVRQEWAKGGQRLTVEWDEAFERLASVASHGGNATLS